MTYGSVIGNEDLVDIGPLPKGSAWLILTPDEHEKFKRGEPLSKWTGDHRGSSRIDVKMARVLSPGDEITIFEDPQTETRPEGNAILVSSTGDIRHHEDRELQRWIVEFPNDPGQKVPRDILV